MLAEVSDSQDKPILTVKKQQHCYMFFHSIGRAVFYSTIASCLQICAFKYFLFYKMMEVIDGDLFILNPKIGKIKVRDP